MCPQFRCKYLYILTITRVCKFIYLCLCNAFKLFELYIYMRVCHFKLACSPLLNLLAVSLGQSI